MKVFLTGGTGFVGRRILHQLSHADHSICLLHRNPSPSVNRLAEQFHATVVKGDILDSPSSLAQAMSGCEAVIHLVAIISEASQNTFDRVIRRGTENIVEACGEAQVKRFLHMSALGTKPDAPSRYHQSKWKGEEAVRNSGIPWTIFRPSIIYGPGDGFVSLFARIIRRSPAVPIIGSGESKFQPVPVEVVAAAFAKALQMESTIGQTYDLVGNEVFTLNELVETILRVMNRRRIKLHIPEPVARCQASILEKLYSGILGQPPPLNRDQVLMLREDNASNSKAVQEIFGLKAGRFEDGIREYLAT